MSRGKGRRRGQRAIFVGYGQDTSGLRVIDLSRRRVVTSAHVGVVPGLGGPRDFVTSIRQDPWKVAKHGSWVWRLYRFEPRARLAEKGQRVTSKFIVDWVDPVTMTPEFLPPRERAGLRGVGTAPSQDRRPHEPSREVRESHPRSKPFIARFDKELVGTDVNDQSRAELQPPDQKGSGKK